MKLIRRGKLMVDLVKERRALADTSTAQNKLPDAQEAKPGSKSTATAGNQESHSPPHLNNEIATELVLHFKLLADETRLRILFFLMHEKELNVRSLCDLLKQSQPAVSHHLALLRNAKLIDSRRDGKHNFYHLKPDRFQQLIDTLATTSPGMPSDVRFDDYVKISADA
jgi:ArsR family transcriptional regulator, arsenate/arsenite/antimonite-responsive transcriptional repressor